MFWWFFDWIFYACSMQNVLFVVFLSTFSAWFSFFLNRILVISYKCSFNVGSTHSHLCAIHMKLAVYVHFTLICYSPSSFNLIYYLCLLFNHLHYILHECTIKVFKINFTMCCYVDVCVWVCVGFLERSFIRSPNRSINSICLNPFKCLNHNAI